MCEIVSHRGIVMKKILIVGGTSGLGLALARFFAKESDTVFITGRNDPQEKNVRFFNFYIGPNADELSVDLDSLIGKVGPIDLLIYAAGFEEKGTIDELGDSSIQKMTNVGFLAPAMMMQRILRKQGVLNGFIAVTSTSQWIPRLREPVYTGIKAGTAMLASSLSLDERIGKVLVVGPSGMNTEFWRSNPRDDLSSLLDPKWVAEQIMSLYRSNFQYKLVRILRGPPRIEELETR
ncbi:MAG: SDR family oxidoreductase [Patescibacteria group bacterium]